MYFSWDPSDIGEAMSIAALQFRAGLRKRFCKGHSAFSLILVETVGCFIKLPQEKRGPTTRATAKMCSWEACRAMHGSCSGHRTAEALPICFRRGGKMIRMLASG